MHTSTPSGALRSALTARQSPSDQEIDPGFLLIYVPLFDLSPCVVDDKFDFEYCRWILCNSVTTGGSQAHQATL